MKYFMLGLFLVLVATATGVSGFHKKWLLNTQGEALVSQWNDDLYVEFGPNLIAEYAPLPERDRTIIKYYCKEIYDETKLLVGANSRLPPDKKPGCQAPILGGWYPNWTIADGIEFLRDPVNYRR